MPELPEIEALRQTLDDPVRAFPIERAGPAHVATLKTIDPPLQALEGRRLAGAGRRGKRLLFEAEDELAHLGPEALGLGAERLAEILTSDSRRLHPLLRDQRAIAGIGRAWSNEILHTARLSPFALSTQLSPEEVERLAQAIDD